MDRTRFHAVKISKEMTPIRQFNYLLYAYREIASTKFTGWKKNITFTRQLETPKKQTKNLTLSVSVG